MQEGWHFEVGAVCFSSKTIHSGFCSVCPFEESLQYQQWEEYSQQLNNLRPT
jgi:hypothetical protein